MPVGIPDTRTTTRRWRKILAPLVIGPTIAVAGLAIGAGSASAQCSVSDGILQQTASSERTDSVRCLQQALNEHGFHAGPVDGWFGPMTGAAVTAFQTQNHLTVDGWMGRETRTALGIERVNAPATVQAPAQAPARRAPQAPRVPKAPRAPKTTVTVRTGASGVNWDAVARCESGGQWSHPLVTNRVGTFGGGLMIMQSAWRQYGGGQFASTPGGASRAEQIIVAERIAARVGAARAWECPTPHL